MRNKSIPTILVGLALVLPSATLAQAPAPESYLVRRTTHVDDDTTGYKINIETTIFRDGLVVEVQRLPNETVLIRARGTAAAVLNLQRTLSRNRFGSQPGRCYYRDLPGQGEVYRSAVTWFGRTGQSKVTLNFGDPFRDFCSDGFVESIRAIEEFFSDAAHRPGTQVENLPEDIFGVSATPPPPSP